MLSDLCFLVQYMYPQTHEIKEKKIKIRKIRTKNNYKPQMSVISEYLGSFEPQMEGIPAQNKLEENEGKEQVEQTITTFDDAHIKHQPNENVDRYVVNNTMPLPDLNQFLCRPIFIASNVWSTTDAIGVTKGNYAFPNVLFTNTMMNKLEKIAFWKPDIEISIRMNGTPMHFGRLVFAWIPQANTLNPSYYTYYTSMFSNKWIQVSASTNQVTVIRVPFTHYKEFISIGKQDEDLFTLFSWVSVPLSSVNGAAPNIQYTIYARVVEPNLIGYNVTTNWTTQMWEPQVGEAKRVRSRNAGKTEAEEKTRGGAVISDSVNSLSDTISLFDWVPVVGNFANPVAKGVKLFGSVLKMFGLNVPVNLDNTTPMQIRQPRLLQFEDCPTTMVLGPVADGVAVKDYALVNDSIEAASILRYVQRPGIHYTGIITSSDAAGTNVYYQTVHPMNYGCGDYLNAFDPVDYVCPPVMFMTKYAAYWRGGLRFHVSFIASHFHSLRVKIWYIPYQAGTLQQTPPNPTELQTTDVISTVLDVTKETDYSFTIPYCQQSEWLIVGDQFLPYNTNYSNGYWGIQIVNELTSGAATVNPIYYQVFISAAADFQLAGPNAQGMEAFGVFSPQSDFPVLECEVPSMSMECLLTKDYPSIGNVGSGVTNHGVFNFIELTGIKQLCNMLCPYTWYRPTNISMTVPSGFRFNPLGTWPSYDIYRSYHWLSNMMVAFRYFRGGLRFHMRTLDPDAVCQVHVEYAVQNGVGFQGPPITIGDINAMGGGGQLNNANAQFAKMSFNPADMVLPWYYYWKCAATAVSVSPPIVNVRAGPTAVIGVLTAATGFPAVSINIGGADDFILGFQLGVPLFTNVLPT